MKKLLFIAAFSCCTIAMAQSEKSSFVSFNIGASIPNGDFADDDVNDEDAGIAKTGFMADINFGHKFSENIGIMVKVRHQSNPVNVEEYEDELNVPGVRTEIDAENWKTTGGYVGLFIALPAGEAASFEIRGLAGIAGSTIPGMEITMSDPSYSVNIEQSSGKATSVGFIFGGGFKFFLSENIAFNLNADYFSTTAEFEDMEMEVSDSDGNYDRGDLDDYEQSIQTINLSAGISVMF